MVQFPSLEMLNCMTVNFVELYQINDFHTTMLDKTE